MEEEPLLVCELTTPELIDKIISFMEILGGIRLYAYQVLLVRRIIESVLSRDGADISALFARQSGKTASISLVCSGLPVLLPVLGKTFRGDTRLAPFARGFNIGIYAPIDKQAKIPFGRIRSILSSKENQEILQDEELDVEVTTNRSDCIGLSNGSEIICRTASPDSQIEGETHHLVILEEAQRLTRQKVEKEINPMLSSTNGTMCRIGTAWMSRGGFHQTIQRNVDAYRNGGPRNHFEFPYDVIIDEKRRMYEFEVRTLGIGKEEHLNYEKYITSQIEKLGGTNNEEFKMNYMCLWSESRIIAVGERLLKVASDPKREAGPSKMGIQIAGLDLGKTIDPSVLTVIELDRTKPILNTLPLDTPTDKRQKYYKKHILDWFQIDGAFEGNTGQYIQLIRFLEQFSVQLMVVDATSIGDVVVERLQEMVGDHITLIPYMFNLPSKANLYKYYLQEFNAGRLTFPAGSNTRTRRVFKEFWHQHEVLDKVEKGAYVTCEAPEGEHDDYPDSGALAVWGEREIDSLEMPEMECTGSASEAGYESGRSSGRASRYARRW